MVMSLWQNVSMTHVVAITGQVALAPGPYCYGASLADFAAAAAAVHIAATAAAAAAAAAVAAAAAAVVAGGLHVDPVDAVTTLLLLRHVSRLL